VASVKTALLGTTGSSGDVHPFIAIGQELQARGFRVVLVTSQYFEPHARAAGLELRGLGTVEDCQSIIADPGAMTGHHAAYNIITSFDAIQTIVVAQGQFFAAHLAHEKLGYPFAAIQLTPAIFRSVHDFPLLPPWIPAPGKRAIFQLIDALVLDKVLAPRINTFRVQLGLPPVTKILARWTHSPLLNLGLFPDWFAPPQPDWPPHTRLTGFVFHDHQPDHQTVLDRLDAFLNAGDAPIVFTPGTAMKHADQFFRDCVAACQTLNRRGILVSPHTQQIPGNLPPGIEHFPLGWRSRGGMCRQRPAGDRRVRAST